LTNGLMPYAARDIFGTDQTGLGYLIASVAAGAFIGSIIMTRSGMRMELARIMIVAAVIWHILVLIFAQMTTLWAGIVMLMLCGFAQSLTMVCHTVILLSTSTRATAAGSWGCGCWRSTACRSACSPPAC
jgi:predicted MFS family arabinose efflux permease